MFMMPDLKSATNIRFALGKLRELLRQVHDAADAVAPDGTPEIWNAITSIDGALRDIAPAADKEHADWLKAEYERQKRGM